MRQSIKRFFFHPLSASLILFFILLNVAAWSFRGNIQLLSDPDTFIWNHKIQMLESGELKDVKVVILGDSQTMSGIVPGLLEKSLGKKTYNLGLPAMQPEGLEAMVPLLKRAGVETVIVNINPYCLFRTEVFDSFLTYYRSTFMQGSFRALFRRPDLVGKSAGQWFSQALTIFPAYAAHENVQYFFTPASAIRFPGDVAQTMPDDSLRYFEEGWNPRANMKKVADRNLFVRRTTDENAGFWTWKSYSPPDFSCKNVALDPLPLRVVYPDRPGAVESWKRVVRLLKDSGIRTIFVQIPFSGVWKNTTDPVSVYGRLDARLLEILSENPEMKSIPRPENFPDTNVFHDWTHLSPCGASLFTRYLIDRLQ